MSTPKDTLWNLDPHTQAKHEILSRYLGAWFAILGKWHNVVYIDGFCGPGQYSKGEDGSPIVALREALKNQEGLSDNQVTFLFMDERPDRIEHLEKILSKFPLPRNFTVRLLISEFEGAFGELLNDLDKQGLKIAPTFAFIDPFGFKGLPFSLVERLLSVERTETFINLNLNRIIQFLAHPDDNIKSHFVSLFGTTDVLRIVQESSNRENDLRLLYQEQLKKCAKFVRFFSMRDKNDKIIYDLFFATNNRLGHIKMKEAFWKVDEASGFKFSDATNPHQRVLFEINETHKLAQELYRKFLDRRLNVHEIREYVEDNTGFLSSHMKSALTQLEEAKKIIVAPKKDDGTKRRKGTFPDEVIIDFVRVLL